jgi:hypothetical protein
MSVLLRIYYDVPFPLLALFCARARLLVRLAYSHTARERDATTSSSNLDTSEPSYIFDAILFSRPGHVLNCFTRVLGFVDGGRREGAQARVSARSRCAPGGAGASGKALPEESVGPGGTSLVFLPSLPLNVFGSHSYPSAFLSPASAPPPRLRRPGRATRPIRPHPPHGMRVLSKV